MPFCGEPLRDIGGGVPASFSPLPSPVLDPWSFPAITNDPWGSVPSSWDPTPSLTPPPPLTPAPLMNPLGENPVISDSPMSDPPMAQPPAAATVVQTSQPTLSLNHSSGQAFRLQGVLAHLGRRGGPKTPEIDLADLPYSQHISRIHAHIHWDPNRSAFVLTDDRSTNGTFLNGKPLDPGKPYLLRDGDQVELGHDHLVRLQVFIR
ncbi:MAG: FHA domain-containing protein [Synechococcaceae cyanobacterium RM1_1_27]|nr:FHA domain-containing protein [Synechococcaceae cyanobacterium RM1_1_27]